MGGFSCNLFRHEKQQQNRHYHVYGNLPYKFFLHQKSTSYSQARRYHAICGYILIYHVYSVVKSKPLNQAVTSPCAFATLFLEMESPSVITFASGCNSAIV